VWIDDPESKFSEENHASIDQALQQWEEATDQFITFELVDGPVDGGLIVIRPDKRENIREDRGVSAVTDFSPLEVGGTITIPYDQGSTYLRVVLLHELGHCLGLGHSDNDIGVMASPTRNDIVTCQDVQAFCDSNGCEAETMPPCL
jgi:predicted Zn-dependent protease